MALIINGVTVQEIARKDGLREEVDILHGPTAQKGYLVAWGDRYKVAQGLLGSTASTILGGLVTLYYPAQYPEISTIYCHHISIEPVGSPTQGTKQVQWPYCILWADYARLPFFANNNNQLDPTHPQLFATQKVSISTEHITIPSLNLQFSSSGNPLVDEHYAFRMALMEYEITYKQVPYLPSFNTFLNTVGTQLVGTINSASFLGVPAGKVLFNGITTEQSANYDGSYTQDVFFSFTVRVQQPWDYAWDSKAKAWDKVVVSGGSTGMLTRADFSALLPNYSLLGGF